MLRGRGASALNRRQVHPRRFAVLPVGEGGELLEGAVAGFEGTAEERAAVQRAEEHGQGGRYVAGAVGDQGQQVVVGFGGGMAEQGGDPVAHHAPSRSRTKPGMFPASRPAASPAREWP